MQKFKMRLSILCVLAIGCCLCSIVLGATRHEINIPDIPGYKTLKCDFHMHTVFSDGLVWPTVRVEEAWRDGLDVIAITDHIEYQPHKKDIPTRHNRSYEIASERAKELGVLVVRGCEITRAVPPGHFNVLFAEDNNAFDLKDLMEVMKTANAKGTLVFWNHPLWHLRDPNTSPWTEFHSELVKRGWLTGIEVVNQETYCKEAHQWCLEKNLTMTGNSDIHDPTEAARQDNSNHRPMTLVFAKDKTIDAVKDAMKNGRTAIWSKNILIGKREYLEPLFYASIKIEKPQHSDKDSIWVTIKNSSDIEFVLKGAGEVIPADVNLPANGSIVLKTKKLGDGKIRLSYTATNLLIAPGKGLPVTLLLDDR